MIVVITIPKKLAMCEYEVVEIISASDMLDFIPAFLAISHNLHTFLEQDLELLGPLLHLMPKPSHFFFREREREI